MDTNGVTLLTIGLRNKEMKNIFYEHEEVTCDLERKDAADSPRSYPQTQRAVCTIAVASLRYIVK